MEIYEYVACDATELAALIRDQEITADDAYRTALRAIADVNEDLNAVADGPWERHLDYDRSGPFSGVPFVIKDSILHAAGIPTREGSRLAGPGIVHSSDTHLMGRFRAAGFATAAVTTTPEFAFNANTEPLRYGSTRNPWDTSRSAGGSSGGTAALVAAGAVPVGHANDGGGSIRQPAAFNGLVGLKPSRGRVSCAPDSQELLGGLGAEFVLCRTVRDCAGVLDAVGGPARGDLFRLMPPNRPFLSEVGTASRPLRIAVSVVSKAGTTVDGEVMDATLAAADLLASLGHEVGMAEPQFDWEPFVRAQLTMWSSCLVSAIDAMSLASGLAPTAEHVENVNLATYASGRLLSAQDLVDAKVVFNSVSRVVGSFFADWDVLLTPTTNTPALPLGFFDANDQDITPEEFVNRIFDNSSFTCLYNVAGTPAMSVPFGATASGLPIGIQLAADMCREDLLIGLASQIEEARGWSGRRPRIFAGSRARDPHATEERG